MSSTAREEAENEDDDPLAEAEAQEPLVSKIDQQPRPSSPTNATLFGVPIKYLSFVLFVLQNVSVVLMLRFTRSNPHEKKFIPATAVISAEAVKLMISAIATYTEEGSLDSIYRNKVEALKTSVPAMLYLVQNNLIYFAVAR